MNEGRDASVIDVWGYLKSMWGHKWIWLLVFALVFAAGGAYALTRPKQFSVTQTVLVSVPSVASEAEATQQVAALTSIAEIYRSLATKPPVADSVLAKHPEIGGAAMLREVVKVGGLGLVIELTAEGPDARQLSSLLKDLSAAMAAQIPGELAANPAHLKAELIVVEEPLVKPASSGRTMLLAASLLGAMVAASLVTGLLAARKR